MLWAIHEQQVGPYRYRPTHLRRTLAQAQQQELLGRSPGPDKSTLARKETLQCHICGQLLAGVTLAVGTLTTSSLQEGVAAAAVEA